MVIIGLVAAAVTSLSYAAATTFDFHDGSPIRREVFGNVSDGLQIVFYIFTTVLIFGAGWMLSLRVRNWERGAPDRRPTSARNLRKRLRERPEAVPS